MSAAGVVTIQLSGQQRWQRGGELGKVTRGKYSVLKTTGFSCRKRATNQVAVCPKYKGGNILKSNEWTITILNQIKLALNLVSFAINLMEQDAKKTYGENGQSKTRSTTG